MTAKTRKIFKITVIVLLVLLILVGSVFAVLKIGEVRLREQLSFTDGDLSSEDAYDDSSEIYHNGQGYVYNDNLINILCVGVDKEEKTDKRYRQADALYLLSLDTETKKLNILAISRNTLADIDVYDINNEFLDTDNAQICLSYVYGKDDEHSSLLTSKAVSRLLYDLPINSYYTVFMDGVVRIVDNVGGVKVTVPEDMTLCNKDWKKGNTVVLNSSNVMSYLQYRTDSNEPRMQRHIEFIKAFINSAKETLKNDVSLPLDLYNKLAKNSVTDIGASEAVYLIAEMADADISFHSVKGESGFDGMYETFVADDEALYETVLNLFYIKTN